MLGSTIQYYATFGHALFKKAPLMYGRFLVGIMPEKQMINTQE